MPDDSIVLRGGANWSKKNDVWSSTDYGKTWNQLATETEWSERVGHTSVVLHDGSILLIGGYKGVWGRVFLKDVWRLSADTSR